MKTAPLQRAPFIFVQVVALRSLVAAQPSSSKA